MQDGIEDTIGNTIEALMRPRVALGADGVTRVAVLYSDLGDFDLGNFDGGDFDANDGGFSVVYQHRTGEALVGVNIASYAVVPPFDILCANLPPDAEDEALSFTLRFLRVRRPEIFLLFRHGESVDPQADDFPRVVRERTERLDYKVYGNHRMVGGMLWVGGDGPASEALSLVC